MSRLRGRLSRCTLLLLAAALLGGCTQWRYRMGDPVAPLDAAPPVGTPLSEVLDTLGPPLRISATPGGYVLSWERWHVRENSLGISLGLLGAEFVNLDWGVLHADGEFLLLGFDRAHRLSSVSASQWDNRHGGGRAVQPLFSFIDVVEAGALIEPLPTHRWGASLEQGLPQALNRDSSPDAGTSGLEQRGTPPGVGQRTLELD